VVTRRPATGDGGPNDPSHLDLIAVARDQIDNNEIEAAIETITPVARASSRKARDAVSLNKRGLKSLAVRKRERQLTQEEVDRDRSQIAKALLDLLADLEQKRPSRKATNRNRFLKDVCDDVAGRLSASIHRAAFGGEKLRIELGVDPAPEATQIWVYKDIDSSRDYETVGEAFESFDRRMLLLGAPGSGKTTSLLFLAQKLIAEAEADADAPVPLLINLSEFRPDQSRSSWLARLRGGAETRTEEEGRPLEHWLVGTLARRAGVKPDVARGWIAANRVAFFLDGLDEVDESYRAKLAAHLNEVFLADHPKAVVVLCCRVYEYLPLQDSEATRARLRGGVVLQPLTSEQIDVYLEAAGATGLRAVLPGDAALREMAQTPLTLTMMTLAYGGLDPSEIPPGLPLAERRHHLMAAYVAKMLQRKEWRDKHPDLPFDNRRKLDMTEREYRYSPPRVNRYLGWLAVRLSVRMRNAFSPAHFFDLLNEGVARDPQSSVRLGLEVVRGGLGLVGTCAVGAAVLPWTIDALTFVCLSGMALTLLGVLLSVLGFRPQNPPRSLTQFIGAAVESIAACAMVVVTVGVVARALAVTIPGGNGPFTTGLVVLYLVVVIGLTSNSLDVKSERPWSLALLGLISTSLPAGLMAARWFGPSTKPTLAIALVMTSAMVIWFVIKIATSRDHDLALAVLLSTLFGVGLLWVGTSVVTLDWHWIFAALATLALGALTFRPNSPALFYGVALASVAGQFAGGMLGAVLGAGTFVIIMILFILYILNNSNKLTRFIENLLEPAVHGLSERLLFSPLALKGISLSRELPVRFGCFLDYAIGALLLKRSAGDVEFMHRTLRDYFAMRDLLPRLRDSDKARRLEAIRSLGYQGESSIPWLADLVRDPDPHVREAAASGLGVIASPETPPLIEVALSDPEPAVRKAGVLNLPNLREEDQKRLSLVMSEDRDLSVLSALLETLADDRMERAFSRDLASRIVLKAPESMDLLRTIAVLVRRGRLVLAAEPTAIPVWAGRLWPDLLRDSDPMIRAGAAKCVGLTSQRTTSPRIIELLARDPVDHVRASAAAALGRLGGDEAVEALIRALSDREAVVRASAVVALGRLGDVKAVGALIRALSDRAPWVRAHTAETLGRLGDVKAVEALIRALSDREGRVRASSAAALGRLGDVKAVEALIRALSDRDDRVRARAAEALGRLGHAGEKGEIEKRVT
jgi:HEAT repeat protein